MSIIFISTNKDLLEPFIKRNFNTCNTSIDKIFKKKVITGPYFYVYMNDCYIEKENIISRKLSNMFLIDINKTIIDKIEKSPVIPNVNDKKFLPLCSSVLIEINKRNCVIVSPIVLNITQKRLGKNTIYNSIKNILKIWKYEGTLIIPIFKGLINYIDPLEMAMYDKNVKFCHSNIYIEDNYIDILLENRKYMDSYIKDFVYEKVSLLFYRNF